MEQYFGSHIDIFDGLIKTAEKIKNAGGNIIQIFLTMPGSKHTEERNIKELKELRNYLEENQMICVVHSSYMHNLCRKWDKYSWWIKNLELEIKYCSILGAKSIILHLGKKLDLSLEEAYNNMYTSLVYIHNKTKQYSDVKILLETPTGQGSQICYKLDDYAYFYKKLSNNLNKDVKKRFKVCLDTCHVFTAGYDLRTKETVKIFLETFDELIGLKNIKLLHLNDSKVELGSLVDRHENIGKGYIGYKSLEKIKNFFQKNGVPIVLETPNEGYRREIKLLK